MNNTSVLVVGGGIAGFKVIQELEKHIPSDLTLVEPREYVEVTFAALRGLVDPGGIGKSMRKPWKELTGARHLLSRAVEISGNELLLEDGTRLPFKEAVIATGSSTKGELFVNGTQAETIESREREFQSEHERLEAAKSVLIIGGGPIGVELAGEIVDAYPDKSVILVQANKRLLPTFPPRAGEKALRVLRKAGVEVILNTRLQQKKEKLLDDSGRLFETDLVYAATGIRSNPIPVDGASFNDRRQIKVDATLRVAGRENLFAIGDVNDVPEVKLGASAMAQASVVAENIMKLRNGQGDKLKSYTPAKPFGAITLGRRAGIVQLPFGRLDFLIGIKQKDMMISMILGKA